MGDTRKDEDHEADLKIDAADNAIQARKDDTCWPIEWADVEEWEESD